MTNEDIDFELTSEQIDELEEENGVPFQNNTDEADMSAIRYSAGEQE